MNALEDTEGTLITYGRSQSRRDALQLAAAASDKAADLAIAVADACVEARADAQYITRQLGGGGAVREAIELILRCQGQWPALVERYRGERLIGEGGTVGDANGFALPPRP